MNLFLLAALTSPLLTQQPTQVLGRTPPPTRTPFLDLVRQRTAQARLSDLSAASAGDGREVRVWHWFGESDFELIIFRESESRWRALRSVLSDDESRMLLEALPDTADWAGRWRNAVEAGLFNLPPYPARDTVNVMVLDGNVAVMEWFDGRRYGISGADHPDVHCFPDDRRLLRVLTALLASSRAPACPAP